jgi:hypothetical protein
VTDDVKGTPPPLDVALVSQMRAGTHFMCASLRLALEAALLRARDMGRYSLMDDADILKDLHSDSQTALPTPRPDRNIYFSHYYHPHHSALPTMPRISLIGFPLDSFYSDGVVYSDSNYSAGPSSSRPHAGTYVFRHGSKEWDILEERMHQNADWLTKIGTCPTDLVIRYEDLCENFTKTALRIEHHLGGFINPMPRPVVNRTRTYWTRNFASKFDPQALLQLREIFAAGIARFYPECVSDLEKACSNVA